MGIDAVLVIQYPGEKPTDEQISRWSWGLAEAIGAEKFSICDGEVTPEAYEAAQAAWVERWQAHPLTKEDETVSYEERKRIVADIGEMPRRRTRAIELTNSVYPLDEESCPPEDWPELTPELREPGRCATQDGPLFVAGRNSWLLEVNLWTRYYAEDYERGDILTICAVAEWVEANIPGTVVWYGGDSSGVLLERFDEERRLQLRRHLYSPKGREYFSFMSRAMPARADEVSGKTPKPCGLCIPGEPRFVRNGFGMSYAAVSCGGCGKSFETRDGETWTERKEGN